MVTAADTTMLIDIINGASQYAPKAVAALREARLKGVIVICDVVYAEVCTAFDLRQQCDSFLTDLSIKVESLDGESSFIASRSWINYRKSGGKRVRILPDFLVAAHATNQADALLTRDRGYYRDHFPKLRVIEP